MKVCVFLQKQYVSMLCRYLYIISSGNPITIHKNTSDNQNLRFSDLIIGGGMYYFWFINCLNYFFQSFLIAFKILTNLRCYLAERI